MYQRMIPKGTSWAGTCHTVNQRLPNESTVKINNIRIQTRYSHGGRGGRGGRGHQGRCGRGGRGG